MAFDLTKPSMADADWPTFAANIRENFRAIIQDTQTFSGAKTFSSSVVIGSGSANSALTIQKAEVNFSGTLNLLASLRNAAGTSGVGIGLETTSNNGIIAQLGGQALSFYTYNGSAYGERLKIAANGAVSVQESGGNLTAKGFTSSDGGTATQATSITTGVTLNTTNGQITTVTAPAIAAGAEVSFTVMNSNVATTSNIILTVATQFSTGEIQATVKSVAAGSFVITLTNISTTAVSTGTAVINFQLIGGSAT